jgi:hypothetical protein
MTPGKFTERKPVSRKAGMTIEETEGFFLSSWSKNLSGSSKDLHPSPVSSLMRSGTNPEKHNDNSGPGLHPPNRRLSLRETFSCRPGSGYGR